MLAEHANVISGSNHFVKSGGHCLTVTVFISLKILHNLLVNFDKVDDNIVMLANAIDRSTHTVVALSRVECQ